MCGDEMSTLGTVEMAPGPNVIDDEELEELLQPRHVNPSNAHPVGTIAMMQRELGELSI